MMHHCKKLLFVFAFLFFVSAAFAQSAGHFIANAVNAANSRSDRTNIYDKLAIVSYGNQVYINDIWVQAGYSNFNLDGDGNSKGSFNDDIGGLSFGYGKEIMRNVSLGFFGKYNAHAISQEKSSADINSYGIGAYGGYLYKDFDFKGILSLSGHQYSTERDAGAAGKGKTDFNGYGINADLEVAMWIAMTPLINLRPYAGLTLGYAGYGSSNEIGAGNMNLDTESGSYTRSTMRLGTGVNGKYDKLGWYGGLELEYILTGKYVEIESKTGGSSVKTDSKGAETDAALIAINAGGDYDITSSLKGYANLSYKVNGSMSDFGAGMGIAFIFSSF